MMSGFVVASSMVCWWWLTILILTYIPPQVLSAPGHKQCVYSFTVPSSEDVTAVCSPQHNVDKPRPAAQSRSSSLTSESQAIRKLLLSVNKLILHQGSLANVESIQQSMKELSSELEKERKQRQKLQERIHEVQSQVQFLTSGQTTRPQRYENLEGFTGLVHKFSDCPVKHPDRVHTIAPIKSNLQHVVRILPKSCSEWQREGHTARGMYLIDPDGLEGLAPFNVECIMGDEPVTIVHHKQEKRTHVLGYEEPGSYTVILEYNGVSLEQLSGLVKQAYRCDQFVRWECLGASLTEQTWWVSASGQPMDYWGGGQNRGCACNLNRTCYAGNVCNCDANDDRVWLEDSGDITDKDNLPVSRLQIGDTGGYNEQAYHTVGPLRCFSNDSSYYKGINAFLPVQTWMPFNVFCDYDGWLVILRHSYNNLINFNRDWAEYKAGFGELDQDFWLGLDRIYELTSQEVNYTLQVTVTLDTGIQLYAQYVGFTIGNETEKYRLHIGEYDAGTLRDHMSSSNGMAFSTNDRDNDLWTEGNCALEGQQVPAGGWWYNDCGRIYPNSPRLTWGKIGPIHTIQMKLKSNTSFRIV